RCLSDWSSDVCSSDLHWTSIGNVALDMGLWPASVKRRHAPIAAPLLAAQPCLVAGTQFRGVRRGVVMDERRQRATGGFEASGHEIGRASCRERVCMLV